MDKLNENHTERSAEEDIFASEMRICFERNIDRLKPGYRYTEDMKLYSAYHRMLSGRLAYETFKANSQRSVPSVSAVDRFIAKEKSHLVEGVLRAEELSEYLTAMNLPRIVALSEDATRITSRIQYDSRTNELVGFVLPLAENGMPIAGHNVAKSAAAMEGYFHDVSTRQEKKTASYLNVVMAQPLAAGIPAFCILLFGTDTKYTSAHITKRWQFIIDELRKKNIGVLAFSSDSDPKYNSVMKYHIKLGQKGENNINFPEWFNANLCLSTNYAPIQDTIHIGTKLRNRLLNTTLKIGKYDVKVEHLESLVENFTKEKHFLCLSTIKTNDRQNFDSVLRICDEKVIDLLSNVDGSEGTILYLRVLSNILQSFLDSRLTPIERIRKIWFSTFILRIWKKFIIQTTKRSKGKKSNEKKEKGDGSLQDQFISQNCYACVEINAHSLVFLMLYLKERKLDHLFNTEMLGSQQCESFFRQIRSLTSTYSTVSNGSLLEIIHRITKIELQNKISHIKLKHYSFPRLGKPSGSYYPHVNRNGINLSDTLIKLPSQEEIIREIELAKIEAIEYAETLGIHLKTPNQYACVFPKPQARKRSVVEKVQTDVESNLSRHIPETINRVECDTVLQLFSDMNLKPFAKKVDSSSIDETSRYVKVRNNNGEILSVEKHTLCWLLGKSTSKLSSDRLIRVMAKK